MLDFYDFNELHQESFHCHHDVLDEEDDGCHFCGGNEDVISVLTIVCRGVAQVFHVLLVELRLLLVVEVEDGEKEDGQEESEE